MSSVVFAWRCLVRQPGRAVLGILGIAAVGALLFDMLLLSRGLVVSLEDLLDRTGFDVRVMSTDGIPLGGPMIPDAVATATAIADLREVDVAVPLRLGRARTAVPGRRRQLPLTFVGAAPAAHPGWTGWHLVEGRDLHEVEAMEAGGVPPILINGALASWLGIAPGAGLALRGSCAVGRYWMPVLDFRVVGIAEFPLDGASRFTVAASLSDFARVCGEEDPDEADLVLVASRLDTGAAAAAEAIRGLYPQLYSFTTEELLDRFERVGFTYFRQIAVVLATITLCFGFLLTTTILTVAVNQRFVEIAGLRALGFSRRRIATDLLWESGVLVGAGGLLALPLAAGLAAWLDAILRSMPGVPPNVHFFVFEPRALVLHVALLGATAVCSALYPVWLAACLPIAATLRDEVVS